MKRLAVLCAVGLGLGSAADVNADGGCPSCGHPALATHQPFAGHQPWYHMIVARDKCRGRDQARLQQFWHDYYRTLSAYYGMIENMDWVSYYKHHGTPNGYVQANCGGPASTLMAPAYIVPGVPYGYTQNLRAPWSPPHVPWGPGYSSGHCSECSP